MKSFTALKNGATALRSLTTSPWSFSRSTKRRDGFAFRVLFRDLALGLSELNTVDRSPEFPHTALSDHHMLIFAVQERAPLAPLVAKLHGAGNGRAQAGVNFADPGVRDDRLDVGD